MTRAELLKEWGAPRYEHDCEQCRFLGGVECRGKWYDLYAHGVQGGVRLPTLVARYGSEGPDYNWGLHRAALEFTRGADSSPLAVALERAVLLASCRE